MLGSQRPAGRRCAAGAAGIWARRPLPRLRGAILRRALRFVSDIRLAPPWHRGFGHAGTRHKQRPTQADIVLWRGA